MKKTMFVGQAMPRVKRNPHDWPTLNKWLYEIGVTDEQIEKNFFYSALVGYYPGAKNGSHLVPTPRQVQDERERLKNDLVKFGPELLVTVGRLSCAYCLQQKEVQLKDVIGKKFVVNPYGLYIKQLVVIPLPHPSGASVWRHNPENRVLLQKALGLVKEILGS